MLSEKEVKNKIYGVIVECVKIVDFNFINS